MKVVIQRVNKSSVEIDNKIKSEIQKGLLVLIGIGLDDNKQDVEWLAKDRKSTRLNSSHSQQSRMPSSA